MEQRVIPERPDGRFAPSPTGELHLGNLRTALLAWLFARSGNGRFLLRIEDLDTSRVRPGMEESQLADLSALGLDWDGEVVRQSERLELYEDALARLDALGLLYPCYCTRREISAEIAASASAPHTSDSRVSYPGTCRDLSAKQRAELEASGRVPAMRFRSTETHLIFQDVLLGVVRAEIDNFVVRRNDGSPAYQLAVVVDDAEQGIKEVVRGADLADSTPRQILLFRKLGLPVPRFAHVPLVIGADGQRLAKRHGSTTLRERLSLGESVEDVRAWMARSLCLARKKDSSSLEELLKRFSPERIPPEPTIWTGEITSGD